MLRILMVACFLLLPLDYAKAAPDIRPVPGSGAAYLYFPGEGAGRVKLKIAKEFANMLQDRYEVYYMPRRGGKEQLICTVEEETCEKLLPAGQGILTIKGFYDPANKLPINAAKFTGSCSTTGARCNLNLKEGSTETVRITTGCNASDYSVIQLGNDRQQVLCVGPSPDGKSYLLAAHKHIRGGMLAKTAEEIGFTSNTDGKTNTKIMIDKWDRAVFSERDSAAHYCQNLTVGKDGNRLVGWYVPALQELNSVLAGWEAAKQSFVIPRDSNGYFSSTEIGQKSTNTYVWSGSAKKLDYQYWNSSASVICVYAMPM